MHLFYNEHISPTQTHFTFDNEESKHIVKVLRKQIGDIIYITNGMGYLFTAKIEISNIKHCIINIVKVALQDAPKYQLNLVVAPTKLNDRYEWFLEKATEIGVTRITPVICEHSERKVINYERYLKIIQSAIKQSQQVYIPVLDKAIKFSEFIATKPQGNLFIAHCETDTKTSLKTNLLPQQNCTILIGPEGDFSKKEIALALENKFIPITLGATRLRTETAAIAACHSVAFINEIV